MIHLRRRSVLSLAVFALPFAGAAQDVNLTVSDWPGFDLPGLYQTYEEKWGEKPLYSPTSSDDETYQKVSSGFALDVLHPCSSAVPKYRDAGLIEPWDPAKIPELKNIDPAFLNSPIVMDEAGLWILPTDWGVTAVAYNSDLVPAEDIASLQVFADPKYQGKIALPDASDDVWALAYLATGVTDWTKVTDDQFNAAAAWLRTVHKNVRAYWPSSTDMATMMKSGEILVSWAWPDGVTLLRNEGFPLGYQRAPKEGISTWFCGMVHLKDGPAGDERAYDYVNSWIRPEAAEVLVSQIGYGHANREGMKSLDPAMLEKSGLGPVTGLSLPQLPLSGEQRDRQLAEFEKIKGGF